MTIGYEAKRVFHNRSGLGNYSRDLIRILSVHLPGNEYLLYNPSQGDIPFGEDLHNVKEVRPNIGNALYGGYWRRKKLAAQASKDGVSVFHGLSQELPTGLKKRGIRSVVTVHDLIFLRYPHLYKKIDRQIYTKKVGHACEIADLIVATSEQTRQDLIQYLNIDPTRIEVVFQGCNALHWEEAEGTEITKDLEKHNLPEKYLLFVGTLEERKGVDKVLATAKDLDIPLVMIGRKTPFWEKALKEIDHKQIYTPNVPSNRELRSIYRRAQLFVYPSIFEGFGIPVVEALVNRVPVITSNSSSLKEVAGPKSFTIDPADLTALKAAVEQLWESEKEREEMKEEGYKFAEANFADANIASRWKHIYDSLAE